MNEELFPRPPAEVAPAAVHLPGWLEPGAQGELLAACREWAKPPAGLRTVRMPGGGEMSVRQLSLGRHWYPYGYAPTVVDGGGEPVKPFPAWLGEWALRAVDAAAAVAGEQHGLRAYGEGPCAASYDIALVNFYDASARMGMHRDSDERSGAPVVSFSLGDSCVFRFGNPEGRGRPWHDVSLRSGDAFVFGGPSRLAYHGVPRTEPGSGPAALGLRGRVNVTVRAY
ncbi:alpha-ketoglutarate-dependent dioxygenase AlkB family protein [Streptomyces iconiensis]|uniref:Alpha-ketoglutarate-dependent dioxygenase AlkB n=1 Tax=Streptomyces iconiensis TaxID=1384038 RepID=A0ABT6ZPX7_9ACTN|nr:alpha-ketoglutarate-dependent dioxygenase AlkB [Streptomyces iconiensis]MDJ1131106.1 alpha-ketoglutarate-dependent dioxygenase AlkB [Streptomyces iconiensis]